MRQLITYFCLLFSLDAYAEAFDYLSVSTGLLTNVGANHDQGPYWKLDFGNRLSFYDLDLGVQFGYLQTDPVGGYQTQLLTISATIDKRFDVFYFGAGVGSSILFYKKDTHRTGAFTIMPQARFGTRVPIKKNLYLETGFTFYYQPALELELQGQKINVDHQVYANPSVGLRVEF